jgi:large conductance mechanosensitive channel
VLKEFREFLLRGNIVDLAVAFVIGVAFAAVVNALVSDLVMPVVAAIFGKPDFGALTFTINGSRFRYGDFIDAVISFLAIAAAIFFLVVKPMQLVTSRVRKHEEATLRECPECLTPIPTAARRCAACTAEVAPASA